MIIPPPAASNKAIPGLSLAALKAPSNLCVRAPSMLLGRNWKPRLAAAYRYVILQNRSLAVLIPPSSLLPPFNTNQSMYIYSQIKIFGSQLSNDRWVECLSLDWSDSWWWIITFKSFNFRFGPRRGLPRATRPNRAERKTNTVRCCQFHGLTFGWCWSLVQGISPAQGMLINYQSHCARYLSCSSDAHQLSKSGNGMLASVCW